MTVFARTLRPEEPTVLGQLNLAETLLSYDNQHKPTNYTLICVELIFLGLLIWIAYKKLPKWSASAKSVIERLGLVILLISTTILVGTLVHWSVHTARPFVYLEKSWHSTYDPNYPAPNESIDGMAWVDEPMCKCWTLIEIDCVKQVQISMPKKGNVSALDALERSKKLDKCIKRYVPKKRWDSDMQWKQSIFPFSRNSSSVGYYSKATDLYAAYWWMILSGFLLGIPMYRGIADRLFSWILRGKQ